MDNKDVKLSDKQKLKILEEQVKRDALTGLYNQFYGKELIRVYLSGKTPYESCGLMVIDIDFFKNVNDTYGHLFGDEVLMRFARLLEQIFQSQDIIMRAGGDEFVVLLKNIKHSALVKKAMELVKAVREVTFEKKDYAMTCSVGVCFLPENTSGYTYEHLFENADWALYRAKEKGKNRYEFCDYLQRFLVSQTETEMQAALPDIDVRYLHNDIVATAFEVFEKMNSFDAAMELLLKVIGMRFQLDRITVIRTDIKEQSVGRQYQWVSKDAPEVLKVPGGFSKEDFMTLFQSYDDYGTTVLQHDNMHMYSEQAANLLMQGEAKTVVYAAMYCEGRYTGAISYVVCKNKRYWSNQNRSQFGELTKIISAHLAKNQALNTCHDSILASPEYDSLTGLLSFTKFKEEVERVVVGGYANSHVMIYSDFKNFKYFNRKYGYSMGDQLLKEFSNFVIGQTENDTDIYFTRVVADQFLMFRPCPHNCDVEKEITRVNEAFVRRQAKRFPDVHLYIRTGVYHVEPGCISASMAMDAADYARKQTNSNDAGANGSAVKIYDESLSRKQTIENKIINGMDEAIRNKQFQIYLQPRYSLRDAKLLGAEALVRWEQEDGTLLYPGDFIPFYEENGRVLELDFFVFREVVSFLAKNKKLGRSQVPISVNASILHAVNDNTAQHYLDILKEYDINPELVEIELTETASVKDVERARRLFGNLQNVCIRTTLDDFGAGYSVLNTIVDIPVNSVKIDREFARTCVQSDRGIYFLKQIIQMVQGLGYRVVCEGVETREQAEILQKIGCEEVQGYWFAHPMPIWKYEKLIYSGE